MVVSDKDSVFRKPRRPGRLPDRKAGPLDRHLFGFARAGYYLCTKHLQNGIFDIFKKKQSAEAAPEQAEQQREELTAGLEKTKTGLFSKLARAVAGRSTIDSEVLDNLEEVLITSDVGVETTVKSSTASRSAWRATNT